MKKLHSKLILTSAFGLLFIANINAQTKGKVVTNSKTTDVTTTIHEPGIQIHEPGIEIHEPGIVIHEPGFEIHEPGFQNQGPGHNSSDKIKLQMYPNPAVDIVHIRSEHHHFKAFSIYDYSGTQILDKGVFEVADHHVEIGVSHLEKGLYILVLQADHNQIAVKRFVKK